MSSSSEQPSDRHEASYSVWDPSGRTAKRRVRELKSRRINRALVQGFIGVIAAPLLFLFVHETLGILVFAFTGLTLVLGLLSPLSGFAVFEKAVGALAWLLGTLAGWLTLIPLYLLFFLPFGLLFRRGNRDRLARRFPGNQESYWCERDSKKSSYERQF